MNSYYKTTTILYVENDKAIREEYALVLTSFAKKVYTACDCDEGIALFKEFLPDIVIIDIYMSQCTGIEMAKMIRDIKPKQIILFTTTHTELPCTLDALNLPAQGYLLKPVDKKLLESKIEYFSKQLVLEKKDAEHTLMLEQIIEHQSNITILTDFHTIKLASRSFWNMLYTKDLESFLHMYGSFLELFIKHNNYIYGDTPEEFLKCYNNCDNDMHLVSIITEEGPMAFYITLDAIKETDDTLFVITLTDVSSLQMSRLNAVHEATHDKLTHAYNKAAFETFLERELSNYIRYDSPLCLALLDIDHFKQFNDTFGHLLGDEILVLLAKEVSKTIRSIDTFARWGGEEFVILMSATSIVEAEAMATKIREAIAQIIPSVLATVTVSIGLTQASKLDTPHTLFKRCDKALYMAKNNGRNRVEIL